MTLIHRATAVAFFGVDAGPSGQPFWSHIKDGNGHVGLVVADDSFRDIADPGPARARFQDCQTAGQTVLGYVGTQGNPTADPTVVNSKVDKWFAVYGTTINGIYFDTGIELDLNPAWDDAFWKNYYLPLVDRVHTNQPGNKVGLAAAGYPSDWVLAADFVTIWEDTASKYHTAYLAIGAQHLEAPPAWWSQNPSKVIATVVQASAADVQTVLNDSQQRNTGNLYIYDGSTTDYGHLSPYWDQELGGLAGQPAAIRSVQFPNVHLRMDGGGVTAPVGPGGGTVNCQFGVGPWEKFTLEPHGDSTVAIASVQFPNVHLRMDGRGVTAPVGPGGGTVNCQFGVGPWESSRLTQSENDCQT
jgi:hypothetical protein